MRVRSMSVADPVGVLLVYDQFRSALGLKAALERVDCRLVTTSLGPNVRGVIIWPGIGRIRS